MKDFFGTLGFFVAGLITFRLSYGAWPPTQGNFGKWLSSDSKARWAMLAGLVVGMVGAVIGRAFSGMLNVQNNSITAASNTPSTYIDTKYPFSFLIPPGWLKQKLVQQFSSTGGRVAISHQTHAATLNVSAGTPDRPEWSSREERARAVKEYVQKMPKRIGTFEVRTSDTVAGQRNVVAAEYETETNVRGVRSRRRNGFVSIIHRDLEYTLQWSAEDKLEDQTRKILDSFTFTT